MQKSKVRHKAIINLKLITMFRLIAFVYLFFGLSSCGNNRENKMIDVDAFIAKYKEESFSNLKDIFISQRSADRSEVVYVIERFGGNQPVYFVTYDLNKKSVTEIDNSRLKDANVQDYFTHDEISLYIDIFRKYNFYLLGVDNDSNLYVNPFYADEPPYLLRLKTGTKDSTVRKGYVYELYKDNWYLNKTRRKE